MVKGYTIDERCGAFSARVRFRGTSASRTFDTWREADQWARDKVAMLRAGEPDDQPGTEAFGVWIRRYLAEEADRFATARDKKRRLGQVLDEPVAKMAVRRLAPTHFEALRDTLAGRGFSPQTVRHYLEDCSAVWTAARRKWRITKLENPLHDTDIPAVAQGRRTRVPPQARALILAQLTAQKNPFYAPYAEFLYETSLRAAEPLGLRVADVDRQAGIAYLRVKGGRERPVPLTRRAIELIDQALAIRAGGRKLAWGHYDIERYDSDLVWPITYRGFKVGWDTARAAAGVPEVNPHDLRRERASSLIEAGVPTRTVMAVTGHSNERVLNDHYLVLSAKKLVDQVSTPAAAGGRASRRGGSVLERVKAAAAARRAAR